MSMSIGKYTFEGPFPHHSQLREQAGVYAVLCEADGKLYPMDLGESSNVQAAVREGERRTCWKEHCSGNLMMAAYYTPLLTASDREEIEAELRGSYEFPCG